SELGHGAGSSRRRRRSAARSDVGWRCAGGIRPTLDAGISDELFGTGRRSCDSNPRPRTNGWRAPLPTQCRADAAAYVMGGGIDTVDGGSTACPSALAPLADLLGVLAVVTRRDAIHQPRSRLALGEVLVGQPGGGAQQRAMGGVQLFQQVARRPPLARLHESGIPAVEIIVGAVRIGRLTPAQPLQRWNHLPMPPCYVGEDLAHPPAPQPYLAHLGLVEVLDGRLESLVLLLGLL